MAHREITDMQERCSVLMAHLPRGSTVLARQQLLLLHAVALLLLAQQPLPHFEGASEGLLPPQQPSLSSYVLQRPRQQLQQQPLRTPERQVLHVDLSGSPGEARGGPLPLTKDHLEQSRDAAPGAAAATSTVAGGGVETRQQTPREPGDPQKRPDVATAPANRSSAAEGVPATAPKVGQAGLLLLLGGWAVATLMLLSPLGCLPYVRLCRAANHNRAGVGERSHRGRTRAALSGAPLEPSSWGPPLKHGIYAPSLITDLLPDCLGAVGGALLTALLIWGEYGALFSFFSGQVGTPPVHWGGPWMTRLASWAAAYPPWSLSLSCVLFLLLLFGCLTSYPVSSSFVSGLLAAALGALASPLLLHEKVETGANTALRALPAPLLPAAAAACLVGGLCCCTHTKRLLTALRTCVSRLQLYIHLS